MWAGGAGTSAGYVNLPELTRARYREDPFIADGCVPSPALPSKPPRLTRACMRSSPPPTRRGVMFNTGDLGRMLPDGSLEHFGRVDDQVKIKVRGVGVGAGSLLRLPRTRGVHIGLTAG